ncbi:ADP-ribose pyrophosphatase [Geomicrobium sp. JCM 19037]|uniref:NUDIX hydrolase n=1 Tax=Geomicrobium sp. JCM 19037 TaxID=1460634 RepID=UPI00045F41EB|nr:NUDIX hydrolase [Geomicrobium sp. JCM 19037]GAK03442.1 ADP-ribose pyrophosphatase [Geomicrobium sp. JCM 19037]
MITKDNRVVLVNQYRHAGRRAFFEVPAGMKEAGETNEEAVAREVKEETGYTSTKAPVYLGSYYTNPAVATNQVHSYLMTDATEGERQLNEGEVLDVHVLSWEEVEQLGLTQMFSVLALMLAKQKWEAL